MIKKNQNLCIVTLPLGKSGVTPFTNLVNIVKNFSDELNIITGGEGYEKFKNTENVHVYEIDHKTRSNTLIRIFGYIKTQIKISYFLYKLRKDYKIVIFFIGGEGLILPSLTVKLLKKDLIVLLTGFPTKISQIKKDPLSIFMNYLSKVVFKFSDKIVVYSKTVVDERNLKKFDNKILIAHRHFVDPNNFKLTIPFYKRENIIGYLGTLNEMKGVKNLIKSIDLLLRTRNDINFMFLGEGPLLSEIQDYIDKNKFNDKIQIKGWIKHEELPFYLNKFRLLVLPSYTEGLPNVLVEAMASGLPVVATDDQIRKEVVGEAGILVDPTNTESYSNALQRVLDTRWGDKPRKQAEKFSWDKIADQYEELFKTLLNKK